MPELPQPVAEAPAPGATPAAAGALPCVAGIPRGGKTSSRSGRARSCRACLAPSEVSRGGPTIPQTRQTRPRDRRRWRSRASLCCAGTRPACPCFALRLSPCSPASPSSPESPTYAVPGRINTASLAAGVCVRGVRDAGRVANHLELEATDGLSCPDATRTPALPPAIPAPPRPTRQNPSCRPRRPAPNPSRGASVPSRPTRRMPAMAIGLTYLHWSWCEFLTKKATVSC